MTDSKAFGGLYTEVPDKQQQGAGRSQLVQGKKPSQRRCTLEQSGLKVRLNQRGARVVTEAERGHREGKPAGRTAGLWPVSPPRTEETLLNQEADVKKGRHLTQSRPGGD